VNLRAMTALAERYGVPVGLSDHTPGIETSLAAVALGAACIEKHFTLSRRLYGPDHHASLEPDDLQRLVEGVRQVELALGDGVKERDPALDPVRATFEKSVVSRVEIEAGTTISTEMLTTKRPGSGIPAIRLGEVVGRRAARRIAANELIEAADLG
jgi:N,N'-diacetyllegionaminate synthase